uniref:Mitochondrial cardiolipin hydrolase n=1 Tax=Culicoides sonorensis TaxID=179676 RepID=A0A336KH12_CULSO
MHFHTKSAVLGSIGTLALGTFAYYVQKRLKNEQEIMEVIFTHDKCEEERTKNINYLEISQINFTPRNLKRIKAYIDGAQKTIDAAVYLFNVKELGSAVIRAHERGVTVRVIGCSSMQGATGTQFADLNRAGIPVLFKQTSMCMHHKFCLVDTRDQTEREKKEAQSRILEISRRKLKKSKSIPQKSDDEETEKEINERKEIKQNLPFIPKNGICITGSANWTMQAFTANWENVIVTSNPTVLQSFRREFDRIWDDFTRAQKVKNVS